MDFETLGFSRKDGVAVITLDRPERPERTHRRHACDLRSALGICRKDDAVQVVMLTGAGRAFSSGQDLHRGPAARRRWPDRSRGPLDARLQSAGAGARRFPQNHDRRP